MNNDAFQARGGALIIGSLLWQDNLGNGTNTIRRDWRDTHLDQKSKIEVQVPIRYGRLSGGGIYTMTFANSSRSKPGTAYAIPFLHNPLIGNQQLLTEAHELSTAEGMEGRFIKSTNNVPWSILGILFNKKKIAPALKEQISDHWKTQVEADPDYGYFNHTNFKLRTEKPCILQNGQLNFPWVSAASAKDEDALNQFDFLLATATKATIGKYPSITKMVANVNADTGRRYFLNNNQEGITTFQDARILKKIEEKNKLQKP